MKLYVKSIDAPLSCITCIYQEYDEDGFSYCRIDGACAEPNERRKDCPLSEIPTPHGRLIDADKLMIAVLKAMNSENDDSVIGLIDKSPTIIEAEE